MDKKTTIALLLIFVVLFGYSWFNTKQQEKLIIEKARQDSVQLASAPRIAAETPVAEAITTQQNDSIASENARAQLQASLGGKLYEAMSGTEELFTVENNLMVVKFSNKGGRVASVMLKNYTRYDGKPVYLFDETSSRFDLSFFTGRQINTADFYFTPEDLGDGKFAMRLYVDSASYVEYLYAMRPNSYMIDYRINLVGMDDKIARNQSDLAIRWQATGFQNEKSFSNENNYTTIAYMFPGDNSLEDLGTSSDTKKAQEATVSTKIKWVAFRQQFFSSIIISNDAFQNGSMRFETHEPGSGMMKNFQTNLTLPYSPASESGYDLQFYFGPNKFNILKDYKIGLQKLVPLGGWVIGWINRYIVIPTFDFLSRHIASYGLIILLLTILLKLITYPLTYKSYMSTAKMRVLKPEIDAIAAKFPDQKDAMKKQQATMELYRSAGVNPMGGCLPLLIQFPILIAMFRFFPASIELRQQSFLWADDLSSYDSILNLPFEIPFYGSHVSLFTLLMAVSIFISSKINYNQSSATAPQMAGMKFMMLYMMPVMMVLWFNSYSSGLSYYYLLSNIITIGQTMIFRYMINEEKLHQKMKANAAKKTPKKKSKFMQRYEEALKQQEAAKKNKK